MRIVLGSFVLLSLLGCGRETGSTLEYNIQYSLIGPQAIPVNTCTVYTVSLFNQKNEPISLATQWPMQPGLRQGAGGVYSDAGCTQLAMVNLVFAPGEHSTQFYFKSPVTGISVLEAGDALMPASTRATLIVQVQ